MAPIVIVGAGMAAYGVARELRKLDAAAPLLIVTGDDGGAYAKPMLSNAIALGREAAQIVTHSAQQMAATLNAQVLVQTKVESIETAARTITSSAGVFAYSALVLALGAQPIRLALAGDAAAEVLSVNHIDDYARLRARLAQVGGPARVAILGAGLIGCEFADDLLAGGHRVTLVDPGERALGALAAPSLSQGLARAWEGRAVALRLGTTASRVDHAEGALRVTLADGSAIEADIVLSAVGLRPQTALAQAAGIAVERGIIVDAWGQTSAPGVYALGDCAQYATAGGSLVMPYVAPLLAASRAIAATLAGTPTAIAHKAEAVIVKTPSYKLALAPPAPGTRGQWIDETDGERTVARFVDESGALRGFGLSAHTPALRQNLLAQLTR
jgi:rubredoxin-NAD+ reductase